MNCSKCGASIEEGNRFCEECGTPVKSTSTAKLEKSQQSTNKKIYPGHVVGVLLLVLVAAAIVFIIVGQTKSGGVDLQYRGEWSQVYASEECYFYYENITIERGKNIVLDDTKYKVEYTSKKDDEDDIMFEDYNVYGDEMERNYITVKLYDDYAEMYSLFQCDGYLLMCSVYDDGDKLYIGSMSILWTII